MGLQSFDASLYKDEYVPQRLARLEVCVHACYAQLKLRADEPTSSALDLGAATLQFADTEILTGIALEAGLMANRTLLNFVGIKLENNGIENKPYALTVAEFGLPFAPLAAACNILTPEVPAEDMKDIWTESLATASRSSAHFTSVGATIRVARIGFACYATSLLVRQYFYNALGEAAPPSLITPQVRPTTRGDMCWHTVDPQDRVC
ncbi:hypothetical protein KDX04_27250 [Burkholderia cenocepacia]|uniref:hypothetical protein n=1 Tax=Burkholderia cenocepacia TaxID=95486 RepID=UPI001B9294E4|nr:hypothetical protein [Burkholderia cenocepacia]MBR7989532.1 hypothetical protein [Burkholderia cenocepacia]